MTKIILGLAGPIASGKGTVCQYLKDKHSAEIFRFSTMLRDVLDRFYIEQSRENMQALSSSLRQTFGDELMAKTIANDVKNSRAQIIILDGVRRQPDIKYLREMPNFRLVSIDAEQKRRFDRITKRDENTDDTGKTFSDFQEDEKKEAEQQIKEVAKTAKFNLDNNGTKEELYSQIDKILNEIS
jgi:dephospho-CoA kinase